MRSGSLTACCWSPGQPLAAWHPAAGFQFAAVQRHANPINMVDAAQALDLAADKERAAKVQLVF